MKSKKSKIELILKHWKPYFWKSHISWGKSHFLTSGFHTATHWEDALNENRKSFGWISTESNAIFDADVLNNRGNLIACEIRTVTEHGVHFIESNVSGSKGTHENKLESVKKKFSILGDDGIFALIDIRRADKVGADVYTITTEDFLNFYGNKKYHLSSSEFNKLLYNRMIDSRK